MPTVKVSPNQFPHDGLPHLVKSPGKGLNSNALASRTNKVDPKGQSFFSVIQNKSSGLSAQSGLFPWQAPKPRCSRIIVFRITGKISHSRKSRQALGGATRQYDKKQGGTSPPELTRDTHGSTLLNKAGRLPIDKGIDWPVWPKSTREGMQRNQVEQNLSSKAFSAASSPIRMISPSLQN